MADLDPIGELVYDLDHGGRPSLAWVVRWSEGDREPLAAAWAASWDDLAMGQVLAAVGRAQRDPCAGCARHGPRSIVPCADCAARVRARTGAPPTLAELLAARGG